MATYSFLNINGSIIGPGGSINLGNGSGSAEEAITIEASEDVNVMQTGADIHVSHSLIAPRPATCTIRLLKTSPTNAQFSQMFNLQTASALTHGINVISIRDVARGDSHVLSFCAFKKMTTVGYNKESGMNEWIFDCGNWLQTLGTGTPEA